MKSGFDCLMSSLDFLRSGFDCLRSGFDCLIKSGLDCRIFARKHLHDDVVASELALAPAEDRQRKLIASLFGCRVSV